MTAPNYTTHADALFDPDAPILGSVALQTRDNLISVAGGGTDAPRLQLKAIQPVAAGGAARIQNGFPAGGGTTQYGFMQFGQISLSVSPAVSQSMGISRLRGNVSLTLLQVQNQTTPVSLDIDLLPADLVVITTTDEANYTIATNGEDLWPGTDTTFGQIIGNAT